MKRFLLTFIFATLFAVSAAAQQSGTFRIEVPKHCTSNVQITAYLINSVNSNVPKEKVLSDVKDAVQSGTISHEVIEFTKTMIDIVYGHPPTTQNDIIQLMELVISECESERAIKINTKKFSA